MANNAGSMKRRAPLWAALATSTTLSLAGCATNESVRTAGVEPLERVVGPHDKVAPGGGRYQVGRPYTVGGRTYVPREDPHLDEFGMASWYGGDYHHGTRTANGEVVDRGAITAAHRTMPLPSYVRVTAVSTGRSIIVRVNDRGPYANSRIIDLSEKTAELLDIKRRGISQVRVQYLGKAGLAGSDQRTLTASLRGPGIGSGHDDHTLLAAADLPAGPRRNQPSPTLVADASAAPALAPAAVSFAPARSPLPSTSRATAALQDPMAIDLAGVDPRVMRDYARALPKPAATSAEVIEAELPGASGAPMSLGPIHPVGTSSLPVDGSMRSSYAAERRISAAFSRIDEGDALVVR